MGYTITPSTAATKQVVVDRLNAKTWGKKFQARVLKAGLVSYKDAGCGVALVKQETLNRCMNTFVGRPLVLTRDNAGNPTYKHKRVTPETLEDEADGYISDVYFDANSGWWMCNGIVANEEAKTAIDRIGYVSCAYAVNSTARGGEEHAIPYDEEITQFSGEHLAIVDNPRYEGATIRLNAKNNKENPMKFTWFKKKPVASRENAGVETTAPVAVETPVVAAIEPVVENSKSEELTGDSELEHNGIKASLSALFTAYNAKESADSKDMDGDDEVVCNGRTFKMNALIEAFDKWAVVKSRENAKADEIVAEAPPGVAPAKENAKPDHYKVLLNAPNLQPETTPFVLDTPATRLARGKEMFGSTPKK